ncbi:MAG: RecB-like helicase [Helicobacter sp.]|uniref:RecB-like helicase n=1 Tax=Helicobacter sp. TaxID=218 RepID=UPI002A90E07F|nr:RecB-like helicase [Helicobacter sp.]MDY5616824.1 RecB-like helicase [Helicobacter sp.]
MENALLCLNASAGSGKTYRLVSRYLELLFLGAKPSEILTLTFTKKAAKEMEERIVKSIQEIYQRKNDREYIKQLEFISINDLKGIEQKIVKIYYEFLREDLKITTIDSFFQRILKSFCWYVGVENNFEIQNEDFEAITEIFLELLSDEAFERIVLFCAQGRKSIDSVLSLCSFLDSFKEMLKKGFFVYEAQKGDKEQAMEYAYRLQREYKKSKGESESKTSNPMDFSDFNSLLHKGKTWLTKEKITDFRGFGKIPFDERDFESLKEALLGVYLDEESQYLRNLYEIFQVYLEAKEKYYKQSNTLSFNAVTSKVYELLLQKNFDKEFLYFRLDSTISHILIDEFQDTSILQYEILKPMIDEIKSGKGVKEFLRSFFYVGDIKQSIYRFRGGNPNLFKIAADGMKQESLQKNYRSAKNLVEFVNEVFSNKIDGFVSQEANSHQEGFVRVVKNESDKEEISKCLRELLELGAKEEEIAILLFDNDWVVELAEYLETSGFKVVMDTSAKLVFHNEVRALIEFLKYLDSKNPLFCEEFFMLLGLEKEPLDRYFEILENPPAVILLQVMQSFKISSLSAKKFLEYALGFASVGELLEKVESLQADIVSSECSGIRLMTIHKSKGLEFNHVLVIDDNKARSRYNNVFFEFKENGVEIQRVFQKSNDLRKSLDKTYQKAIFKEEILKEKDLKNQLYVALTRAKNTMHIMLLSEKGRFDSLELENLQRGDLKKALQEVKEATNLPKKEEQVFFEEASYKKSLVSLGTQKKMQVIQKEVQEGKIQGIYYGVALHFVMEQKIKNNLDNSVLLEILCNKMGFLMERESLKNVIKHCKKILKNSHFIEILAKGKVKCEIPFLSNGRQKRLDLLVIGENEAFVIDYKSGAQRESYATQVLEYMQSVGEILQKPVRGFVFYTEGEGRLVEVIGE